MEPWVLLGPRALVHEYWHGLLRSKPYFVSGLVRSIWVCREFGSVYPMVKHLLTLS